MTRRCASTTFVVVAAVAAFLCAGSARAGVITLTALQANSFTVPAPLGDCGAGTAGTDCSQSVTGPATNRSYNASWNLGGASFARFELTGLGIAFGALDSFALNVFNSNASSWDWVADIHTTLGTFSTPTLSIANGTSANLVTGLFAGTGTITSIDLTVSGDSSSDPSVNFNVKPIPEPGTLLLLGTGLLGVARARRRRNG